MTLKNHLTTTDHNRDVLGMKYIYPVISRRAGGVSIGINLNTNNACNWRCIYCNVPNLTRGTPPPIELDILEQELRALLTDVLHGDFMQRHVHEEDRQLKDIAFSGNGEPTSAKEFPQVIALVEKVLADFNVLGNIKVRLITNGSLIDKPSVLEGVKHLARLNGEVWFKVDAGTKEGIARINDVTLNPQSHLQRLKNCAEACPTFIQTCMLALDGLPPSEADIIAYLALIAQAKDLVQGVHLYGLARRSEQAEVDRLTRLPAEWLEAMAERIRDLGLVVQVSP
ncbi:MAG: radical SAM protein [Methylotenera sp.]|nr:radical SAM protein [Methylotenera sp.]MDO9233630.1 radical SAM protein [Methylotenera sp.]MDO9388036.1 radical SAM protein [Methylotenera sp.]MDP1597179.1 radical SAM protein [Methylotenera sp.]MDP1755018.1 radical SAM protein [Methylotenera sp.]